MKNTSYVPDYMLQDVPDPETIKDNLLGAITDIRNAWLDSNGISVVTEPEQKRLDANNHLDAVNQAKRLSGAFEQAAMSLLYSMQKKGMHLFLGEYDSFKEFLMSRVVDLDPDSTELSAVHFLLEEMFPILESIPALPPKDVLSLRDKFQRTKAAVPYARRLVANYKMVETACAQSIAEKEAEIKNLAHKIANEKDETKRAELVKEAEELPQQMNALKKEADDALAEASETFTQGIHDMVEVINEKKVPTWGAFGVSQTLQNNIPVETFKGYCLEAKDATYFYIGVPVRFSGFVKKALERVILFDISDPITFVKHINSQFGKGA